MKDNKKKFEDMEKRKEELKQSSHDNVCKNPWKRGDKCGSTDIVLSIQLKIKGEVENFPICRSCWEKIANSNKEWGDDPQPDFSKRSLPEGYEEE